MLVTVYGVFGMTSSAHLQAYATANLSSMLRIVGPLAANISSSEFTPTTNVLQ